MEGKIMDSIFINSHNYTIFNVVIFCTDDFARFCLRLYIVRNSKRTGRSQKMYMICFCIMSYGNLST